MWLYLKAWLFGILAFWLDARVTGPGKDARAAEGAGTSSGAKWAMGHTQVWQGTNVTLVVYAWAPTPELDDALVYLGERAHRMEHLYS